MATYQNAPFRPVLDRSTINTSCCACSTANWAWQQVASNPITHHLGVFMGAAGVHASADLEATARSAGASSGSPIPILRMLEECLHIAGFHCAGVARAAAASPITPTAIISRLMGRSLPSVRGRANRRPVPPISVMSTEQPDKTGHRSNLRRELPGVRRKTDASAFEGLSNRFGVDGSRLWGGTRRQQIRQPTPCHAVPVHQTQKHNHPATPVSGGGVPCESVESVRMGRAGLEPATPAFSMRCSTN